MAFLVRVCNKCFSLSLPITNLSVIYKKKVCNNKRFCVMSERPYHHHHNHHHQVPRVLPSLMTPQEKRDYMATHRFEFSNAYENYDKIRKIGQGTFGEVWKAKNKITCEIVAMKKILTETEHQGFPITAMREIKILKRVRNDNIVHLKEVVTAQATNMRNFTHYLVFEFCEYDLAGLLSTENLFFHLAEIKTLVKQLLLGLHYLHQNKMLHRDMKSSNVLVNKDGILKLADFGLSRPFSDKRVQPLTNRVVTLWYRAPELLLGDRFYTPKIDIWGAGCIMAEMWTRYPILQGGTEQKQLQLIGTLCGSINPDTWPEVQRLQYYDKMHLEQGLPRRIITQMKPFIKDAMACDLLDKLLTLNPTTRLDADGALDHDFFFSDPMPVHVSVLKDTFAKIGTERFEYFTNRRVTNHHHPMMQQQMMRPVQQQQQPQQQQRQAADFDFFDRIY